MIVLSARSKDAQYDPIFLPSTPYTDNFAYSQGTSMSSPVAAGAIALILEKYSEWDYSEIVDYFNKYSREITSPQGKPQTQLKTKTNPDTWDRDFGYGGIDLTNAFSTDITNHENKEKGYQLQQNFPNPFNTFTTIRFTLNNEEQVEITVYNTLGKKIVTLPASNSFKGEKEIWWNGKNVNGDMVASGVYFYCIKGSAKTEIKKMVLIR